MDLYIIPKKKKVMGPVHPLTSTLDYPTSHKFNSSHGNVFGPSLPGQDIMPCRVILKFYPHLHIKLPFRRATRSNSMARLFLLLLLLLPPNSYTLAQHNISLGSTLNSEGPNRSWLSPSGDFAFGFHPVANSSLYLLAFWFDKIDEKTIVWYTNGSTAVSAGSSLQFTNNGMLSLRDTAGAEVWSSPVAGGAYASMNDSGNFVVYGEDGYPKWQSFTTPTDTILPSQELSSGTILHAKLMATDYSNGRFILSLETDGNLTFYTVAVPTGFKYDGYWSTNTSGNNGKLVYDANGTIYYTLENSMQHPITVIMPAKMDSPDQYYQWATLDPDGVLRQYTYPKGEAVSSGLPIVSTAVQEVPTNICTIMYSDFGSGVCGYNSYCTFNWNQIQTQIECACPPSYSFFDPERMYKGCKPDFTLQICDLSMAQVQEQFQMVSMDDVDWPLHAYEEYYPMNETTCQSLCLMDCFCAAAVFDQTEHCWKKKLPLSNGNAGSDVQRIVFLKVPRNNYSQSLLRTEVRSKWKTNKKGWIIGGSVIIGISVFLNFLFIAAHLFRRQFREARKKKQLQPWTRVITRDFTYRELEEATNGFNEEVGRGASGIVYKGHLYDEFGTSIAVKKIDRIPRETEKEFTVEVETIGHTLHKNLIQLLGFCYEGTERLLVYPFMPNGSLTKFLFTGMKPSWDLRVDIAHGVAKGLLYLHEECGKQIIHCDIKPENILLDDNFIPKVSDFGLVKLLAAEQTQTSTGIRGTRGYLAPEWFKNVGISSKVDVYSFGIVLLEIVCCRRNVDLKAVNEERVILTYWAYDCYYCGRLDLLVKDDEEAIINMKMVERFARVALWCIQDEPAMRPTMLKVTKMLDGAVEVPQPPIDTPTFICSLLSNGTDKSK
ncbi:hypothetical protein BS78_06G132400 [Paspalum vaginatum]|nr:hypothetical protein BS78_06G132400 [Paspalum vaginatum]